MHHAPARFLGVAAVLALILGAPRAAVQDARPADRAADGITIQDRGTVEVGSGAGTSAGPASVSDLTYFEENGGGGGPRGLYDFTSTSGGSVLRAAVGGTERLFSLTIDPATGVVYGVDPLRNDIFTVDPNTGAVTFVVSLNGVTTIANITFDPVGGQLFAAERNPPLRLYTIDLVTGNATMVGPLTNARSGHTFAPDGTLYGVTLNGTLYRIDPLTAVETLVGGGSGPGLAEDGTARADGALFVTDFDGDIFRIDPATGVNTLVGNSGSGNGLLGIVPSPSRCPRLVRAVESIRLGTPANPNALRPGVTGRPIVGNVWNPGIDHTTFLPGAVADVLLLGATPLNTTTPFGTLLCSIALTIPSPGPGVPFTIPIPENCSLVGGRLCTQGIATDGVVVALANAIDITIGSF